MNSELIPNTKFGRAGVSRSLSVPVGPVCTLPIHNTEISVRFSFGRRTPISSIMRFILARLIPHAWKKVNGYTLTGGCSGSCKRSVF